MTGIVVIAMETDKYVKFLELAVKYNIPHFELAKFFEIEQFKTLDEVECWWLNK